MFLSVIIPTYNSNEKLLVCLDSLLIEKNNIEIIIIDDGSKIPAEESIKSYFSIFNNIKVYRQQNLGVSAARNFGLSLATGDLVWFIDADDWISDKSISLILSEFKKNPKLEVLEFDYCTKEVVDNIVGTKDYYFSKIETPLMSSREYFIKYGCSLAVTNKVFKRRVLLLHEFTFPVDVKMGEEMLPILKLYVSDVYVKKIKECLYFYFLHNDSATHNVTFEKVIEYNKNIIDSFKKMNLIVENEEYSVKKIAVEIQSFLTVNFLYRALRFSNYHVFKSFLREYEELNLYPIPKYSFHNKIIREVIRVLLNNRVFIYLFYKFK